MWDRTPWKKQKKYYSGKKKRHTFKLQIIANAQTKDVICIAVSAGNKHDFTLLKDSCIHLSPEIEVLADRGYQGIVQLHANSTTPIKASKNRKLSPEEKKANSLISKRRIYIEHINRYIKRFRILSSRYRNKRKKFGLRASLICGIFNFQHLLWRFPNRSIEHLWMSNIRYSMIMTYHTTFRLTIP